MPLSQIYSHNFNILYDGADARMGYPNWKVKCSDRTVIVAQTNNPLI